MDDMSDLPWSRRQILAGAAVLVLLLVVAGRLLLHAGTTGTSSRPLPRVAAATASPAPALLVVDVVGAVRHAGLRRLPHGARVADAIARAGGATRRADLAQVNLAAPLADGEQVVVPARGVTPSASGAARFT